MKAHYVTILLMFNITTQPFAQNFELEVAGNAKILGDNSNFTTLHVATTPTTFTTNVSRTAVFENTEKVSLALRSTSSSIFGTHEISFERPIDSTGAFIRLDERQLLFGRMTFTSKSGTFTSPGLFLDLNTGRLGVGMQPAANKLEVDGDASKSTAGGWLANSDRRIKEDIHDISNAIQIISELRPVSFRYTAEWRKRNPSIEDRFYYNFIAQEYRNIFPNAVKGSGEYLDNDSTEILQIDTYGAQIVTIKAVQELIEENQKLLQEMGEINLKMLLLQKTVAEISTVMFPELKP